MISVCKIHPSYVYCSTKIKGKGSYQLDCPNIKHGYFQIIQKDARNYMYTPN